MRPRVVVFCRCATTNAVGGIESMVSELVPRLSEQHPEWDVAELAAFSKCSRWNSLPLLCDVLAGIALWWKARNAQVVLVNGAEYAWLLSLDPRYKKKTVIVWHGTRAGEIPALRPHMNALVLVYWCIERWLQSFALRFRRQIVVAPSVLTELRRAYGLTLDAQVVVNGAQLGHTSASVGEPGAEGRFVVVWSGTNAHKKGLDLAIAAAREARSMIPNLELRVFGLDGGDPKEPWVSWEGRRPRETVLHAVALADAYLATSRYEACSMAIIEALSVGTTVVGSPAVAWMLDGAGIAVLDYQPGSFAREIERLSASPALRRELAAAAPAAAARFSWDEAAASYGEIISSMLPRSELNA